jgi:thioredoxin 2
MAATRTVKWDNCGRLNRVPAAARGRPRCGNRKAFLPWIVDASDEDFAQIAEQTTVPVLVDLWAAWCGPCRMVSPALEQLAREKAGQLKLVTVDVERAPKLAQRFAGQAVPTLMVLHQGKVARQPGAAPVNALRRWLDDAIARIHSHSQSGGN